ncbi:hypothetical protein VV11_010320 [Trichodesmium erythraeum 21-75]|nr:hypothetical protein [Trichodesmium erythraeum 21-75]
MIDFNGKQIGKLKQYKNHPLLKYLITAAQKINGEPLYFESLGEHPRLSSCGETEPKNIGKKIRV